MSLRSGERDSTTAGIFYSITFCASLITISSCGGGRRESYEMDEEAKRAALQELTQQGGGEVVKSENRDIDKPGERTVGGREVRDANAERESRPTETSVRSTPSVSLKTNGIPLRMAMERLAAQADWRVRWGEAVDAESTVAVDVSDMPLQIAVEDLAAQSGYSAEFAFNAHTVTIQKFVERTFYLPEIWARRQMPLPGNGNAGVFIRYAEDPATGVENSIRAFLSPQGKVFVDPINGTVLVRDEHNNMKSLERHFARLNEEARSPWLVEVAILLASPGEQGVRWDRVAQALGSPAGASEGPESLSAFLGQTKDDPVALLLKALDRDKARLLSRPKVLTLNGWTVQLAVASGQKTEGAAWEVNLTTHRDYTNPGHVVIEVAGGLADRVAQSFSTTASAEIGQPLIISTGVGSSIEKGWLGDKRHTQEAIFVIRVMPFPKP